MNYKHKKISLVCVWIFFGLVFPVVGYMIGPSQEAQDAIVGIGCTSIVITYLATLVVLFDHLSGMARHMALVAAAYVISALCLILIFASYISYFGLYVQGDVPDYHPMLHEDIFDPIYLSATTFTTLGIGDLFPQGFGGKFLVVIESLLGVTHSVAFVALIHTRLGTLARDHKTKSGSTL
jgi:hypothetical protein